jgi:transposase
MSEADGIDSISGGTMPRPYSRDLRERVIESIEAGVSRREAAELYGISPSVVVIWVQRWTGSTEWRQYIAAGGPRRISAWSDHRTARSDAGRSRCGDVESRNFGQSYSRVAFLRTTRLQLQKKHCTRRSKSVLK